MPTLSGTADVGSGTSTRSRSERLRSNSGLPLGSQYKVLYCINITVNTKACLYVLQLLGTETVELIWLKYRMQLAFIQVKSMAVSSLAPPVYACMEIKKKTVFTSLGL